MPAKLTNTARQQWAAAVREAGPELELAMQLKAVGIPFERQYVYAPPRKFRADLAFPAHRLLVEVVGGVYTRQAHGSISGILKDIERLNHATRAGWLMMRVTPDHVRSGEAIQWIEEMLT